MFPSNYNVIVTDKFDEWNEYVEKAKEKTIFHFMREMFLQHNMVYYVLTYNDKPILGIPFKKYRRFGFSIFDSSLYCIPFLGFIVFDNEFLFKNVSETTRLINFFTNFLKKGHFTIIRIVNPPYFKDVRPFLWNGWDVKVSYTYVTVPEKIEGVLGSRTKKWLRRAYKDRPDISQELDWNTFMNLYKNFSIRKGFYQEKDFKNLELLGKTENKNLFHFSVISKGNEISVEVMLVDPFQSIAYRLFALSTDGALKRYYNYIALVEAIKKLKMINISKVYLLGAPSYNFSIFVSKFATNIEPYYWLLLTKPKIPYYLVRKMGIQTCPWL
jgi:hypothetical protein